MGIGPDDPGANPFLRARLPALRGLLDGAVPTLDRPAARGAARVVPLDATLGHDGTPRSGTGQVALLTGVNAADAFEGHFGPWVPVRLRPLLAERNVMTRAREAGRSVTFANAYPPGWPGAGGSRRLAGVPMAAREAGVMTRGAAELSRGEAVASGILNDGWRIGLGHTEVPEIDARTAGANLARLAARFDLTVFAHYETDHAGHAASMPRAVEALERVDGFLGGLLGGGDADLTVLVVSDHGNIEDVRGGHTRNPVMGLVWGPGAEDIAKSARSLMDVAGAVLGVMGIDPGEDGTA